MDAAAALEAPETSPTPGLRLTLGGVAFEVLRDDATDWRVGPAFESFCAAYGQAPTCGVVSLSVCQARELAGAHGHDVRWRWESDEATVRTPTARGAVRHTGGRRYVVSAVAAPTAAGIESLLTGVGSAVVHHRGGLVLHAASVRVREGLILLIGPSGAGKSTAADLMSEAEVVGFDRAVVYPTRAGWYGAGLPGGTPTGLPLRPSPALPLAGIFRVVQGDAVEVLELSAVDAVQILRESTLAPSECRQDTLLDRAARLADAAPVRTLRTALNVDPTAAIERALR